MDIEWLLLLCIPVVVKVPYIVHYIVRLPTLSQKQMEIYPRAHQQEIFFLAPFLDGAYSEY